MSMDFFMKLPLKVSGAANNFIIGETPTFFIVLRFIQLYNFYRNHTSNVWFSYVKAPQGKMLCGGRPFPAFQGLWTSPK